jgi:filamentous hemagglutinin
MDRRLPGGIVVDAGEQELTTPKGRKLTAHAQESLKRHGFDEPFNQVDEVIDNATRVSTQADGGQVHIRRVGQRGRKYDIVIEGDEGIVTGLRNLSKHELDNLGKNYGFNPNP